MPAPSAPPEAAPTHPRKTRAGLAGSAPVRLLWVIAAAAALLLGVAASIAVGSKPLPLDIVLRALIGAGGENDVFIVLEMRAPRALLAVIVGAALGLSGALIQALTRNPLADPGILGVNAGAAFAVTVGVGFFGVRSITGTV